MKGIFSEWQPRYAEQGKPTFPVKADKKPAIRFWQRVGLKGSADLAEKFLDHNAIGLPLGRRTNITILDLDEKDPSLLREAQARHGQSPFIIETVNGHHLYYRHSGERRLIKPFGPDLPIDILGGGFAVAPPSIAAKGAYEIIRGSIEDIRNLPPLGAYLDSLWQTPEPKEAIETLQQTPIPKGTRNNIVFRLLLREALNCDDFDTLLDVARSLNMQCIPPLSDASLLRAAKQVWKYETSGNNWVGKKARARVNLEEIGILRRETHAHSLLNFLRVSHPIPDMQFAIDQVKTAAWFGWHRTTVSSRIETLIKVNFLERVHSGKGLGDPHIYRLKKC